MTGIFDDFLWGCSSDCVEARGSEPDRPLCERCKDELPADRMLKQTCLECMDTEEIGGEA